ncbi:MAG: GntR family transcriptional regulator [Ferrovibrio sp.]|uniref:GntR family transcriptional regulator n=1 Tax=Ferrovibrio sp. TaxID=1917215 RepID=UPI002630F40E|nr:GntR family transcriptional regulator [Ferrovibrio sp.]MCW0232261.1 GntR family transcriptional regulator [Ferrovibrio sp.]
MNTAAITADAMNGGVRRSQTRRAYDELKRRILDNELPPGTQALEQQAAEWLGMSRTPVREALIRLAQEGMVEVRPRHGMRVLPIAIADLRDIYDLLAGLEATAADIIARRGLQPAETAELDGLLAETTAALARDDLALWAEGDARFHRRLVEMSCNQRLILMVETIREQSHRARMATLRLRPKPVASNEEHAALVAALRRRDAEAAVKLIRAHRLRSARLLIDLLEHHGLDQL